MKEQYLISLDLDGTLLTSKTKIPFKTRWYLRSLAKHGHVILINTGRPLSGALKFYKQLNIRKYPLAIINGASIVYLDKSDNIAKEISSSIDLDLLKRFCNEVKPFIKDVILVSNRKHYIYNLKTIPSFITKYHHPKSIEFIDSFDELDDEILAFSLSVDAANFAQIEGILMQEKYQYFSSYTWGVKEKSEYISYQLTNADHSKSGAIRKMQELYDIDNRHIIAFGDSYNDIDMIQYAHVGVVMKNGRSEMVSSLPLVSIKDHNHQGVYHYLKRVLKIR